MDKLHEIEQLILHGAAAIFVAPHSKHKRVGILTVYAWLSDLPQIVSADDPDVMQRFISCVSAFTGEQIDLTLSRHVTIAGTVYGVLQDRNTEPFCQPDFMFQHDHGVALVTGPAVLVHSDGTDRLCAINTNFRPAIDSVTTHGRFLVPRTPDDLYCQTFTYVAGSKTADEDGVLIQHWPAVLGRTCHKPNKLIIPAADISISRTAIRRLQHEPHGHASRFLLQSLVRRAHTVLAKRLGLKEDQLIELPFMSVTDK